MLHTPNSFEADHGTIFNLIIQGNNENKVVEDRKRFLQYFCDQMAALKYLTYSDEFQTFLRTKNADIEKVILINS